MTVPEQRERGDIAPQPEPVRHRRRDDGRGAEAQAGRRHGDPGPGQPPGRAAGLHVVPRDEDQADDHQPVGQPGGRDDGQGEPSEPRQVPRGVGEPLDDVAEGGPDVGPDLLEVRTQERQQVGDAGRQEVEHRRRGDHHGVGVGDAHAARLRRRDRSGRRSSRRWARPSWR